MPPVLYTEEQLQIIKEKKENSDEKNTGTGRRLC